MYDARQSRPDFKPDDTTKEVAGKYSTWTDRAAHCRQFDRVVAQHGRAALDFAQHAAVVADALRALVQHPRVALCVVLAVARLAARRDPRNQRTVSI